MQELRDLWGAGTPTLEIGRRLGVTKSAVIGKARRLGLPCRPSPVGRKGRGTGVWADAIYTEARMELARALTAQGMSRAEILPQLNALPGKPIASADSLAHGLLRRGIVPPAPVVRPHFGPRRVAADDRAPPAVAPAHSPSHPTRTCEFPLWPDNARPPRPPLFCGKPVRMKRGPRGDMVPCWTCAEHAQVCFTIVPIRTLAA